jgi:hypothetical protein
VGESAHRHRCERPTRGTWTCGRGGFSIGLERGGRKGGEREEWDDEGCKITREGRKEEERRKEGGRIDGDDFSKEEREAGMQ